MLRDWIIFFAMGCLFLNDVSWAEREGVNPDKVQAMKAAAPLNNSVKVSRMGRVLKLDYELVGSDGQTYSLWDIRDNNKPTFAIYQDGVQVTGGAFEFG